MDTPHNIPVHFEVHNRSSLLLIEFILPGRDNVMYISLPSVVAKHLAKTLMLHADMVETEMRKVVTPVGGMGRG